VVLTLTSVTGPVGSNGKPLAPASQSKIAKPATSTIKLPVLTSGLQRAVGTSKLAKPIVLAGWGHSNAIVAGDSGLRIWEHVPVVGITAKPVAVSKIATGVNPNSLHNNVAAANNWMGQSRAIAVPSTLGWMGTSSNRRVPVKTMPPSLVHMSR
jgi:hypothetical protein